jgi:hypothetical protein
MRISLPSRVNGFALALPAILAGALFALVLPSSALATEPCPNEPYRVASNSTQLPDCRAYELVSPADAGGTVGTFNFDDLASGAFVEAGLGSVYVAGDGSLDQQLRGVLDVQGNGEDVFWNSTATPPGTGALPDGGAWDPFRSVRTPSGWSTRDLMPSGLQIQEIPGGMPKLFIGASADGSTALVLTLLALYPSAFANPQQAALGESRVMSIYRVSTDGGFAPQLVTHGEFLLPEKKNLLSLTDAGPFQVLSASPDLKVVTFRSTIPLESYDNCIGGPGNQFQNELGSATTYLWNASSIDGLAHVIFGSSGTNVSCTAPNVAGVPAVLPDGRPILTPNPMSTSTSGPLVENSPDLVEQNALEQLAGPSGGTLLSATPDGSTAYVLSSGALDANYSSVTTPNIYAVSTTLGTAAVGIATPGVTCISCSSDQTNVTYVTTSRDGAHVLFTTDQGLWEWDSSSGAQLLTPTPVTDLSPESVVVSENGRYVVGLTSQLAHNPHGTADLYEFGAGRLPTLITSGTSADSYTPTQRTPIAGVSDDGQRVVYNDQPPEVGGHLPPEVIDEWDAGQTTQLSPQGSQHAYQLQAVAGDQLQDVFFIAYDALVPWDVNAGQADIYDARAGGGFPFCTTGNPGPPAGVEGCGAATSNANPTAGPTSGYAANLTPPGFQLASLPADTSQPASTSKPRALTRAQKLSKALKACKRQPKKKLATCVKRARKQYAPTKKKGK